MAPRYVIMIIAATAALGGAVALAKPNSAFLPSNLLAQAPIERGPGAREPGWLKDLNLTPEQVQKIRALRNQDQNRLSQQRRALRQAHQELRELMASNAPAEQVRQKYDQVKALRQQLGDAQFNNMLAMRELLTPEQRRKFADQMQRHRDRFRGRMGEGRQERF